MRMAGILLKVAGCLSTLVGPILCQDREVGLSITGVCLQYWRSAVHPQPPQRFYGEPPLRAVVTSVFEHYDQHLGPVYAWMIGDLDDAGERNLEELRDLGLTPGSSGVAVDLGAGPGLHAIPAARLGFSVLAIDSCPPLLETLRERAGDLPIRAEEGDLLTFRDRLDGPVDVILCMGDTLTHLPSRDAVEALLGDVSAALAAPGAFVTTFRDYASAELHGSDRFIPARSDESRSLTCFLEYSEEIVTVHDLLHEREDGRWRLRVSSYPKLRLDPAWVAEILDGHGLVVQQDGPSNGMVRMVARRD